MPPDLSIIDIAQLGAVGILLFINRDLWARLNTLQDRMFTHLDEGRKSRAELALEVAELRKQIDKLCPHE